MLTSEEKFTPDTAVTSANIQRWLVEYLASLLDVEPTTIDPAISFDRHGIDSASAVALVSDLAEWLGAELEPTLLYDYPTVETLSAHLFPKLSSDKSHH